MRDSFKNTDMSDSEIRSSKAAIADSTISSNAKRRLNDSFEPGDSFLRHIPGGKTLESNAGKILYFGTLQMIFYNNYLI